MRLSPLTTLGVPVPGALAALWLLCFPSCQATPRPAALAPSLAAPIEAGKPSPDCCAAKTGASGAAGGARAPGPNSGAASYVRRLESYSVPDVVLVNQDGERVRLREALDSSETIVLNFVFTTCTTICPVMSATFAGLEKALEGEGGGVRLVSISLDPEFDSPEVLREYAARYRAGSRWQFLTGDSSTLARTYQAFNAVTGSKFAHQPFTLFKRPGEARWLRIEGLTSMAILTAEYQSYRMAPAGAARGG